MQQKYHTLLSIKLYCILVAINICTQTVTSPKRWLSSSYLCLRMLDGGLPVNNSFFHTLVMQKVLSSSFESRFKWFRFFLSGRSSKSRRFCLFYCLFAFVFVNVHMPAWVVQDEVCQVRLFVLSQVIFMLLELQWPIETADLGHFQMLGSP